MRTPDYLSPTSIALFHKSPEDYYVRYLSDYRFPREPQTQPMSAGSAFDAYVKNFLYEALFGKGTNPIYDLRTIFEGQVEAHNRDWAWEAGRHVFQVYKETGALNDLLLNLRKSIGEPRFEIDLEGEIGGVTFFGKPDVFFINEGGFKVILDFKVNGYCNPNNTSPKKGYLRLRPGTKQHRDCHPMKLLGMMINTSYNLEDVDHSWAAQESIYAWLAGAEVGEPFVAAIDQVCGPKDKIRIAEHRTRVGKEFQINLFQKAQHVWDIIHSDWFFRDTSHKESIERCVTLDAKAKSMLEADGPNEDLFREMTKGRSW